MDKPNEFCKDAPEGENNMHCPCWHECEPCHWCGDDTRDPNCDCELCLKARLLEKLRDFLRRTEEVWAQGGNIDEYAHPANWFLPFFTSFERRTLTEGFGGNMHRVETEFIWSMTPQYFVDAVKTVIEEQTQEEGE